MASAAAVTFAPWPQTGWDATGESGMTVRKWSQDVTENSDALDLEKGAFESRDPKAIAASLKKSAERSKRRKTTPFRSAMSMLTFFVNRAGKNLPASRKRVLSRAKDELRRAFGRSEK
jgi:Protein of unknown function (DUF3175)